MIVEHGFMESQCCSENVKCILVKLTVKLLSPHFFEYVNLGFLVNQTVLKHLVSTKHCSSPGGKSIATRYVKHVTFSKELIL